MLERQIIRSELAADGWNCLSAVNGLLGVLGVSAPELQEAVHKTVVNPRLAVAIGAFNVVAATQSRRRAIRAEQKAALLNARQNEGSDSPSTVSRIGLALKDRASRGVAVATSGLLSIGVGGAIGIAEGHLSSDTTIGKTVAGLIVGGAVITGAGVHEILAASMPSSERSASNACVDVVDLVEC